MENIRGPLHKNEKKKKEMQKLLVKLRNYTSKINGSRTVIFKKTKYLPGFEDEEPILISPKAHTGILV